MKTNREQLIILLEAVAKAFSQFKENFKWGKTSDQLFEPFSKVLDRELGEYEILYDYIFGKDSLNIDGVSKNYVPKKSDTVIMDISVGKNGVWCDVCRTFFVGEYTVEQNKVFEMIKESIKSGEAVLKAGSTAKEIYHAVNSVYAHNGKKLVHHAGHQIGRSALMQPQFLEENQSEIESDCFYTIESGNYEEFGIRLENDYFVSADTTENLFENLMKLDIKEYVLNEK